MKKTPRDLDNLKVTEWTPEEIVRHRIETFNAICKAFPDLMEPYLTRLGEITDESEQLECMRTAMRETFILRWPQKAD